MTRKRKQAKQPPSITSRRNDFATVRSTYAIAKQPAIRLIPYMTLRRHFDGG